MARRIDMTMAEIYRSDHYETRRKVRLAAGARILYARVGPRPHVGQELTGWRPRRQARGRANPGFPGGFTVLHSPELPHFRAIVGYKAFEGTRRFRPYLYVDAEAWCDGPGWFHAKSERACLRGELRMVELVLRGAL